MAGEDKEDSDSVKQVINFNIGGLELMFNPSSGNIASEGELASVQEVTESECQASASEDGEASREIDMLVVCKIENEFGYPEQYITKCLKKDIKNDATTCYYLFLKEDKHEIVNLLSESPAQLQGTPQPGRWLPVDI